MSGIHGDVKVYYLSEEERREYLEKYPIKNRKYRAKNWNWQRITKARYEQLKNEGYSDREIIDMIPRLTYEKLHKNKKRWGLI